MLPQHRLPVSDPAVAMALHTIGHPVTPQVTYHDRDGKKVVTWWIDHAPAAVAALMVCGIVPFYEILPPGQGRPAAVPVTEESLTFPGLRTVDALAQHPAVRLAFPPGFPPGEHPWEYALMGARNAASIHIPRQAAEKNPSIWFQGEGTRGALVSQSLLEESNPNSALRDELLDHLA
jgi:hypothetical protein